MPVNAQGAIDRSERLLMMIQEAAQRGLQEAASASLTEALARAPTVDQEYDVLMVGEGGTSDVPRDGGSSADDTGDEHVDGGRRRLVKDEATYLQNVIPLPENLVLEWDGAAGVLRFGNLALLENATTFEYTNWSKQRGIMGPYKKGPYFNAFEFGSYRIIEPAFQASGKRSYYPLRPDMTTFPRSMSKTTTARHMFDTGVHQSLFRRAMDEALSQVGPGRS